MAFKYDIPPFTCRLVHGNYRIYDVNGQQIWKSDGKTHGDKEEAIQKMRELARKQHNNTSKLKKDIVKENLEEANKVIQEALANQVDLTDEERARLQKLSTFIESIRTISTLTGENEEDIIKNADYLNLVALTKTVNSLADRARNNQLKPEEIQGGTFTLTNVGTFGNVMGTPIINQPQVAILATGAIRKKPAVIETPQGDAIGIRQMMFLSLSYDHRVVDGYLGGSFLRRIADYLEAFDPQRTI